MKRTAFLLVVLAIPAISAPAATTPRPDWPLQVKQIEIVPGVQKAWLEDQSGTPFFYNADTCWFLCFKATNDEVLHYLDNRREKGVTVIQTMLLPWKQEGNDSWFGVKAFENDQFDKPVEKYWKHVDWVIAAARERNITLAMALSWSGCCGEGWSKTANSVQQWNTAPDASLATKDLFPSEPVVLHVA